MFLVGDIIILNFKDHLSSVKIFGCGGALLPTNIANALIGKCHLEMKICIGYALTECPCVAQGADCPPGVTGKLAANVRAKFIDIETGEMVGPGQIGELCIQGKKFMYF